MTGYSTPSLRIEDEGTALPAQPFVNFTGAGVAATDDPTRGRTNVTISGGAVLDSWISTAIIAQVLLAPGTYTQVLALVQQSIVGADFDMVGNLVRNLTDGFFQLAVSTELSDTTTGDPDVSPPPGADGTVVYKLTGTGRNQGLLGFVNPGFVVKYPFKPSLIAGSRGADYGNLIVSPVFFLAAGFTFGLSLDVVNNGTDSITVYADVNALAIARVA